MMSSSESFVSIAAYPATRKKLKQLALDREQPICVVLADLVNAALSPQKALLTTHPGADDGHRARRTKAPLVLDGQPGD